MKDYTELVKRLRNPLWCGVLPTTEEAADAIEVLEAENEKLRQTLEIVWQDLHTIKSHIQIAIRHKSS